MQQILLYSALFIGGGAFGWVVDTSYRSLVAGRYAHGTLLPFFSIIYGVAAIMLYALFHFGATPFVASIIIGTILCVVLELVGGALSLSLLHYRLWDYSANPFNFHGFIDLKHTFYWLILTTLYRLLFGVLP
jgi:uncharacterized membrane protein